MNRKMLFFDIDGTIVAEGTEYLPESTVKAIRRARENGHLAFINTGRTLFSIDDFLKEIGFDGYVCGCGTAIYVGEETIFKHTLTREYCREIIEMLRACNITAVFEEENHVFFDEELPSHEVLHDLRARFGTKGFDIPKSLDESNILFDKFVIWVSTVSDFKTFYRYISEQFDCIDRGAGMYEMVPKGISKASGIQRLMDHYGIPLEDCYAFGDSTNDLPMLQFVPNSVAMGNSMKEILPYCAYQTADLEEDGIEKALKHYGII
mgnify:FL=1